ncbi:PEP-CTERM sorting domain-containing protein [Aquincola sp. MAHUQ-54]|uniref:PEP-CTERM sorting domain-containing protein n=1 Tax=Aquincola agrisoli TaxID=3119538 RepID=A0AAW9Q6Q9_9BURK
MTLQRINRVQSALYIGLFAASASTFAQANLVNNGSFESGSFASWTEVGNSAFNGVQCPGAGAVPQGICGAYFGPIGSLGGIQQAIATVPGGQYTISFSFLGDGSAPGQFIVDFGGVTLLSRSDAAAATVGFQAFEFIATANSSSSLLSFNFRNDLGFMELDNVAVTAVPEPGTYALMLAGVGALLYARRRIRRH